MSTSLRINLRTPDPTIRAAPQGRRAAAGALGLRRRSETPPPKPQAKEKAKTKPRRRPASAVDLTGKTDALRLETRDGADLRADEVFEKAGGAVYKVKTERGLGSAVAISDSELLTNCHVVGDFDEVKIVRAQGRTGPSRWSPRLPMPTAVCCAPPPKLPKWVTVRPYEDIKVGRAGSHHRHAAGASS